MYIKNNLIDDEEIIYWTHPHWIIFANTVVILILALIILIMGNEYLPSNIQIFSLELNELLSAFIFIIASIMGISAYIRYISSEYAVTNKRIMMKTGWISRDVLELFLTKVEAIHVNQSIPGRLLNYGTLIIIGTGGTKDPFPLIPDPFAFRRMTQIEVGKSDERFFKK